MKKRILYSILNEWRDEDMDDFPIDLDDMDFEPTSSNMSDESDLDDDEFVLSTTQYCKYFPETKDELKEIIDTEIEKQGGVNVNLNMIDTSKITDMSFMFSDYILLETLDISKWDVTSVENMEFMFCDCKSLRELDVSGWKVSKEVKHMNCMFYSCTSLETLDVSGWDVSGVRNMNDMFKHCKSLRSLDVSGWDVSGVRGMFAMFKNCTSLHTSTRMWKIKTNNIAEMYDNAPNIKRKK